MANISSGLTEPNIKPLFLKQINKIGMSANDSSIYLPQNAKILLLDIVETAGNSITGGLDIGTTAAGVDIASAVAVGASARFSVTDAALLKRIFASQQQLFFTAHTSWNSAVIDVNIIYAARVEYGT